MGEIVISLNNVSKCFKRYVRPVDRLKELLFPKRIKIDEFWALQDINLEIPKGQTLGVVGRNGSGKSTLLQILVGTLTPTTGQVKVKGRVSALLELGSGFNLEFTGRQNVFFNGQLLGLSRKEVEDKFDEIAGFADIGDFIDQPVKTYSSGMFVRLAFAVAVNVAPEVLIVDEALAVGDVVFQHRCMRRMRSMMESGVTTLFVSHDPGAIKTLCDSAIMLHKGRIHTSGLPSAVIIEYMRLITEEELAVGQTGSEEQVHSSNNDAQQNVTEGELAIEQTVSEQVHSSDNDSSQQNDSSIDNVIEEKDISEVPEQLNGFHKEQAQKQLNSSRRGSYRARIEEVKLLNQFGQWNKEGLIFDFNEEVTLAINLKVYEPLESCILGFFVCDKNGNEIIGSNTLEENLPIGKLFSGDNMHIQFTFKLPLRTGSYSLTVAGAEDYTSVTFDWIDNALVFQVLPPSTGKLIHAIVDQPMVVKIIKQSCSIAH